MPNKKLLKYYAVLEDGNFIGVFSAASPDALMEDTHYDLSNVCWEDIEVYEISARYTYEETNQPQYKAKKVPI